MNTYDLVAAFSEKTGVLFRPASPTEVAEAETAGVPESLLSFYREYEPCEVSKGKIRFFPLEKVIAHRTDFLPSCQLARHGYFAFAGTDHGDVYVVEASKVGNFDRTPIHLFSHEINYSRMSKGQVEEFGMLVARGVPEFLSKAIDETLETDSFSA